MNNTMNEVTLDAAYMDALPYVVKREGDFLAFYSKQNLVPKQSKEEPVFKLYLWDEEEVDRLYNLSQQITMVHEPKKEPSLKTTLKNLRSLFFR